jgi:hypothetical protein
LPPTSASPAVRSRRICPSSTAIRCAPSSHERAAVRGSCCFGEVHSGDATDEDRLWRRCCSRL